MQNNDNAITLPLFNANFPQNRYLSKQESYMAEPT